MIRMINDLFGNGYTVFGGNEEELVRRAVDLLTGNIDGSKTREQNVCGEDGDQFVKANVRTEVADGKSAVVYVDIPGATRESINASIDTNTRMIVVEAERADCSCKYRARIAVRKGYDIDAISTSYVDGVLTITIPRVKADAASDKVRKLEIG